VRRIQRLRSRPGHVQRQLVRQLLPRDAPATVDARPSARRSGRRHYRLVRHGTSDRRSVGSLLRLDALRGDGTMSGTTTKNLPYPTSGDGRPHIDQALANLAAKIDLILPTLTDAQIGLLAGADLYDGEFEFQSNAGAGARKWRGLYGRDGSGF